MRSAGRPLFSEINDDMLIEIRKAVRDAGDAAQPACMGTAHMWDVERGVVLAAFSPPMLAVGLERIGTTIDQLALSMDGWLAASVASRDHKGGRTPPCLLLYDVRGHDIDIDMEASEVFGIETERGLGHTGDGLMVLTHD